MAATLEELQGALAAAIGGRIHAAALDRGQLTIEVAAGDLLAVCAILRDDAALAFSTLVDIYGVDYEGFGGGWEGQRFAVGYNLLSIAHNWRVRVRVFCTDDDFPAVDSVIGLWPVANWYERSISMIVS